MILTGETEELGEKAVPVPLCPPQIPHGSTSPDATFPNIRVVPFSSLEVGGGARE
jgi:hypothetical protein